MNLRVLMIPRNHEYIKKMIKALELVDVSVQTLKPFHWSTFENIITMLKGFREGYRIVHIHWLWIFPFSFMMKLFYCACRHVGIKVVWEMHNILPHGYTESDRMNSRWFYQNADGVIFHSEDDKKRARMLLGTDARKLHHLVISHGNFNESYPNNVTKGEARRRLRIPLDKKAVLCFGFIRKNRGYDYLIQAVKNLQDVIVLIAGKILDRDVYKSLVAYRTMYPNIMLFPRWISNSDVQLYFNACDVVVLPYTEITTSGVIPLAYAFSRPVISTIIEGVKGVVTPKTGILVPPCDAEALRDAMVEIFQADYDSMGLHAYDYAREYFSWESNVVKLRRFYENLLTAS